MRKSKAFILGLLLGCASLVGLAQINGGGGGISGGGGSGAPTDATYITQTANSSLSAEQALGSLATGLMNSATTTGVVSTLAPTDDNLVVGSGAAWQLKALTSCSAASSAVTYNTTTNAFGCNTISGAPTIGDTQIAYATAANTLGGDADFTWVDPYVTFTSGKGISFGGSGDPILMYGGDDGGGDTTLFIDNPTDEYVPIFFPVGADIYSTFSFGLQTVNVTNATASGISINGGNATGALGTGGSVGIHSGSGDAGPRANIAVFGANNTSVGIFSLSANSGTVLVQSSTDGNSLAIQTSTGTTVVGGISAAYSSSDGTPGFTGTCTILGLVSITVKNGLITACTS